jgi:hypothetical protein
MSRQPSLALVADAGRQPRRPTLFPPGFLGFEEFATVDALALRLRQMAGPWPLSFCNGAAAYPGFDTFASVTAYAGGEYLATVAAPGLRADELARATHGRAQA